MTEVKKIVNDIDERFKNVDKLPYEAPIGNLFIAIKTSLWDDFIAGKPEGNKVGFIFTRFLMCGVEKNESRFIEICYTTDLVKDVFEIIEYFKLFVVNNVGCFCGYGNDDKYYNLIGNNDDVIVVNEGKYYKLFVDDASLRKYLVEK